MVIFVYFNVVIGILDLISSNRWQMITCYWKKVADAYRMD